MASTAGARLASLLLGGYEGMVSEVIAELAQRGHPGVTAAHELAVRAIHQGAGDASALARQLGVSRQAAAKTIATLEELSYVERLADASDARRKPLKVTTHGYEMVTIGAAAFNALRDRLERDIGAERLDIVEDALHKLAARTHADG